MSMIVAFAGKAGSGKSTVASLVRDALQYRYNLTLPVVSFATPIKQMVQVLSDYTKTDFSCGKNDKFLFTDKTLRQFYQTLGTEWGRDQIQKDFWAMLVNERYVKNNLSIIIDDLRFADELGFVKQQNPGLTFYLQRNLDVAVLDTHKSENDLQPDDCEYVVNNNRQLYEVVDDIVKIIVDRYELLSKNTN